MNKNLPKNEPCPECVRYDNRPLTMDAVVVKDNQILLGLRGASPDKGKWALFGGHVEWDESVEDAVRRETIEESGLKVLSMQLINIYSNPSRHPRQAVAVAYSVEVEGKPIAGDDIVEVKWFNIDQLPEDLAFDHTQIIADYLQKFVHNKNI